MIRLLLAIVAVAVAHLPLIAGDGLSLLLKAASHRLGTTSPTLTRDLARGQGYQADSFELPTSDGYFIRLTRIRGYSSGRKLPVLLMHGLVSSSDNWIIRGRRKDLPYILADNGYDVWLGDWRGNVYSRRHSTLSPNEPLFWNFTYDKRALRDLPVFIDFVLSSSNAPQLFYIGYSFGTLAVQVLTSKIPEYNDKIRLMVLLAPIGYRLTKPYPTIAAIVKEVIDNIQNTTVDQMFELFPRESVLFRTAVGSCRILSSICRKSLFHLFGQQDRNLDQRTFDVMTSRTPSGGSSLDLFYLAQIYAYGFREYSYGPEINRRTYGQSEPPFIEVERITVPTAIYYSPNDHLNDETGVLSLSKRFQNLLFVKRTPIPQCSHLDYLWGRNAETLLYPELVLLFEMNAAPRTTEGNDLAYPPLFSDDDDPQQHQNFDRNGLFYDPTQYGYPSAYAPAVYPDAPSPNNFVPDYLGGLQG